MTIEEIEQWIADNKAELKMLRNERRKIYYKNYYSENRDYFIAYFKVKNEQNRKKKR